ncbi:MAG: C25 family cysteine peptidase, partial [Thermoguttaceae bacterium]
MAVTAQAESALSWLDFNTSDGLDMDREAVVEVIRSDGDGIVGRISIPGAWLEPVVVGENSFMQLSIPGFGFTDVIGAPRLPVVRSLLAVPDGVGVTARIDGQPQLLSTIDVGIGRSLVPLQASVPKLAGALEAAPLDYGLVYETDRFLPDTGVRVLEAGYADGQRLVMLEVAPIAYNPTAGLLSIYDTLTFELDFSGVASDAKGGSSIGDVLSGAAASSPDAPSMSLAPGEAATSAQRLLIVAHRDFTATMADFVAHKRAMGWDVDLVDTNTTGSTNSAIQRYIKLQYANMATRPDALLLVGDTDRIPHFRGFGPENPATDLYYTTMDGGDDWYPEFPVGRFSVVNATQLSAVIAKTIAYETSSTGSWTTEATFMAGNDNHRITEGTHNWVVDNYMDPLGYTSNKQYVATYGATTQDVRADFNNGSALGIFSGHGAETYWDDGPRFRQSDVRGLTNAGMYALIASFACDTGAYAYASSESLMETWLRTPNNGAVVAVGSSVDSYWDEDDILEKRLFDAIYDEDVAAFGSAWLRAKELYLEYYGPTNSTRGYFEMYNVMGDPTVKVLGIDLKITLPSELPLAYPGEPYEVALMAAGGREPYGWNLVEGSLPDGLTLDEATGIISGTPTALTEETFTIEITDADQISDRREFRLSVANRLRIVTPDELPHAQLGQPYSLTLEADGAESPYHWSLMGEGGYAETNPASGYLGGGTAMDWHDDDDSWRLTLPWAFSFYGNEYNSVNVSSNGFLDFASNSDEFDNTQAELLTNVRISPLWDDLKTDEPGKDIFVTQTDEYVAVRWQAVVYGGNLPVDFEAVLYRNGRIQFNYGQGNAGLSPTIGVSAGNGTDYTISSFSGATTIPDDVSAYFAYGGQLPPGLSLDEAAGRINGIPTSPGRFTATFQVQGSGNPRQTAINEFSLEVVEVRALMLFLPEMGTEGDGILSGEVHITSRVAEDSIVTLESDDLSEGSLPTTTVTILAGETSAPFDLRIEDDAILDGTQNITISASLDGYEGDSIMLAVADNETASLTVTLPRTVTEGDGLLVGQGRVSIDSVADEDVLVGLTSDDTSEATVAPTVVIPAGQSFTTFDIAVENDTRIDGTQTATISAHVENWTGGADTIEVVDDDDRITLLLPEEVWEGSGLLPAAGLLTIGGAFSVDLAISLESSDLSKLLVPVTLMMPAGETSAPFALVAIENNDYDGVQTVSITATAPGLVDQTAMIDVRDNDAHHFAVAPVASPQRADVAFDWTVTAKDVNDETIEIFDGVVGLSAFGDAGSLPIRIEGAEKSDPATHLPLEASTLPAASEGSKGSEG